MVNFIFLDTVGFILFRHSSFSGQLARASKTFGQAIVCQNTLKLRLPDSDIAPTIYHAKFLMKLLVREERRKRDFAGGRTEKRK